MPTEAPARTKSPPKSKPETWIDWHPKDIPMPTSLLTRDELLERLKAWGVEVETGDLRFWEYTGILPRPVRRRIEGATRAYYPPWMMSMVRLLRELQAGGYPLRDIGPRLRAFASEAAEFKSFFEQQAAQGKAVDEHYALAIPVEIAIEKELRDDYRPSLLTLARFHERLTGQSVKRIEIRLLGEDDPPEGDDNDRGVFVVRFDADDESLKPSTHESPQ